MKCNVSPKPVNGPEILKLSSLITLLSKSKCEEKQTFWRKLNVTSCFQLIIPYRGEHYNVLRLRVCGDLGQVLFSPFHLKDEESIRKALTHSNVAFNLIGREFETRNFNFDDVHVHGARRLARIARESGIKRFIHVSHVNAAENPKVRKHLTEFE